MIVEIPETDKLLKELCNLPDDVMIVRSNSVGNSKQVVVIYHGKKVLSIIGGGIFNIIDVDGVNVFEVFDYREEEPFKMTLDTMKSHFINKPIKNK